MDKFTNELNQKLEKAENIKVGSDELTAWLKEKVDGFKVIEDEQNQ